MREILVPHCVEPPFIVGGYTVDEKAAANLKSFGFGHPVTINREMFFR
jgi:hypothetical protein